LRERGKEEKKCKCNKRRKGRKKKNIMVTREWEKGK